MGQGRQAISDTVLSMGMVGHEALAVAILLDAVRCRDWRFLETDLASSLMRLVSMRLRQPLAEEVPN
jgi:hypothetical protein